MASSPLSTMVSVKSSCAKISPITLRMVTESSATSTDLGINSPGAAVAAKSAGELTRRARRGSRKHALELEARDVGQPCALEHAERARGQEPDAVATHLGEDHQRLGG